MASSPFIESKEDENRSIETMLQQQSSSAAPAAPKKKRNQPGTPYPDAEVVALSPKTLMATNRFICEVCNKGFQREQNLQLHRRGHNLPWKLKQKSNKEVRRKVYLCPELSCVHHHASRALGDLTGIKKHYFRKHGEKKWKCDKCSKRYAVQSDWKAHSKTCGTREYRCDCGTLFSRRDSFITHRAFCDALAQESARHPSNMSHHLYGNNQMSLGLSQMSSQIQDQPSTATNMLRLGNFGHQSTPFMVAAHDPNQGFHDQQHGSFPNNKSLQGLMQLPDLQGASANTSSSSNLFNLGFFSNNDNGNMNNPSKNVDSTNGSSGFLSSDQFSNDGAIGGQGSSTMLFPDDIGDHVGSNLSPLYMQHENVSPHMSATALLQKAATMGSTTSGTNPSSLLRPAKSERQIQMENENHLQGIMNSFANRNDHSMFEPQNHNFGGFNANWMGMGMQQHDRVNNNNNNNNASFSDERIRQSMGGSDKLTLDFLGVGGMVRKMGVGGMSQKEVQLGINMSGINTAHDQLKPTSFGSSKLQ